MEPQTQSPVEILQHLLDTVPAQLERVPEADAAAKFSAKKWSAKEELGHLLDSAANNHLRIVRTMLEDIPNTPRYEQERWVQIHLYQQRSWQDLIGLWTGLNQQIVAVLLSISEPAWMRTCTIASGSPVTLKFVVEDYLAHMRHHLDHIREMVHIGDDALRTTTEN